MAGTANIALQFSAVRPKGLSAGMRHRFRRWRLGYPVQMLRAIEPPIAAESEFENAKQERIEARINLGSIVDKVKCKVCEACSRGRENKKIWIALSGKFVWEFSPQRISSLS